MSVRFRLFVTVIKSSFIADRLSAAAILSRTELQTIRSKLERVSRARDTSLRRRVSKKVRAPRLGMYTIG
ncbi:unnamed protein product, partial [Iphiclides podalirius]